MRDSNSDLMKKVRRQLIKQGFASSDAAAAKVIRVLGLNKAARKVGVPIDHPGVVAGSGEVLVGGVKLTLGDQTLTSQ